MLVEAVVVTIVAICFLYKLFGWCAIVGLHRQAHPQDARGLPGNQSGEAVFVGAAV